MYIVQYRRRSVINTDPLRRCYNGCNFSERTEWSEWRELGRFEEEEKALNLRNAYRCPPSENYQCEVVKSNGID